MTIGAVQVDRHEIAVDGWPLDHLELGVVLAQPVDLLLHLLVLHGEPGKRHLQPVVAGNGHERAHLDHRVERDRTLVLAGGDVDLGPRDGIELGVDHRTRVEVRQRLAQRLGPQRTRATHARLEHLARHLAGTKARYPHLTGKRPHDVTDGAVDLGLVDLRRSGGRGSRPWAR